MVEYSLKYTVQAILYIGKSKRVKDIFSRLNGWFLLRGLGEPNVYQNLVFLQGSGDTWKLFDGCHRLRKHICINVRLTTLNINGRSQCAVPHPSELLYLNQASVLSGRPD